MYIFSSLIYLMQTKVKKQHETLASAIFAIFGTLPLELTSNEDDEILNEAIEKRKKKRTDIAQNDSSDNAYQNPQQEALIAESLKRIDSEMNGSNDQGVSKRNNPATLIAELPDAKQKSKEDTTATIVNDVNKYGLWEYTADNTDMGDQLKKLMDKAQSNDINAESKAHSLEKQASQMNEKINNYIENDMLNPAPTIDPMETPLGYAPTKHPLSFKGIDSDEAPSHSENKVDVVTIPNSVSIEDEHGNSLDSVKMPSVKSSASDFKPTKPMITTIGEIIGVGHHEQSFPLSVSNEANHKMNDQNAPPIASSSEAAAVKMPEPGPPLLTPTEGLTARLLKALKNSKTFRASAEKLLPKDTDTDKEVLQKQKKLALYLNAYEKASEQNILKSDNDRSNVQVIQNKNNRAEETSDDKYAKLKEANRNRNTGNKDNSIDKNGKYLINHNSKDEKLLNMIKSLIKDGEGNINKEAINELLLALRKNEKEHKETADLVGSDTHILKGNTNSRYEKEEKENMATSDKGKFSLGLSSSKSNPDEQTPQIKQKDGFLSDYMTTNEDLDHPLGNSYFVKLLQGVLYGFSLFRSN